MKDIIARVFGSGMILNAGLFIPQAVHLCRTKTAQGVSAPSSIGFNLRQFTGVLHGWFQGDRALMFGMPASLITCGSVTLLATRYGAVARSRTVPGA